MDSTRRHLAPLPEIPEPGLPLTPEQRARVRNEIQRHMLAALQGCDQRLADHYAWFMIGGR